MADRIQLNNQLASMLTAIVDIPQHLQANQAMLDYVDAQDATKSGTGHTHGLFTLSDVTQMGPFSNRHFLFYNAGDGKWKNGWLNDGDIPNIDMSKVATGSLAWSRISGSPVTLTGYGINNLTLPSLSGTTTGYIMADEDGNLIRVDNPLKAYTEENWGSGTYGAVIDSGDGSSIGLPRNRLFVNPDNGAILQSDIVTGSHYSRVLVQGDTVEVSAVSGSTSSSINTSPTGIGIIGGNINLTGPTVINGFGSGRLMIGTSTDDGTNRLQVSGNTKVLGNITQSGGTVFLNSSGVNRTIVGSLTDDGSNRLQVSGNTKVSGSGTFTNGLLVDYTSTVSSFTETYHTVLGSSIPGKFKGAVSVGNYGNNTSFTPLAVKLEGAGRNSTNDITLNFIADDLNSTSATAAAFLNFKRVDGTAINSSNRSLMQWANNGTVLFDMKANGGLNVTGGITVTSGITQNGANVILNSAGLNRTLIGTTTDDGSNRLQVSGNVAVGGNITLTGIVSSPSSNASYTLSERFGAGSSTTGGNTTAIGATALAGAADSTAVGRGAIIFSGASNGVAIGSGTQCIGGNTTAVGTGAVAGSNLRCTAYGALSSATGYFSTSVGGYSSASGGQSVALGVSSVASNTSTVAAGTFATASGLRSIAIGGSTSDGAVKTSATHTDSIVLGYGVSSTAANQFMIGSSTTNYNMYLNGGMTFTNCPEYTDNAAAVAGGLAVGRVYRTGDLLKIVH